MKYILHILTVIFLCGILQWFLPWWSAAIAGLAPALFFHETSWRCFGAGFVGVSLVWTGYAAWLDMQNASILSTKIAVLFQLQKPMFLFLITALIGGITGGLGGWVGSEIKTILKR